MRFRTKQPARQHRLALTLCVVAGILYNSWPLGYMLDRQTARYALASDLELVGHPYYWLFILCDVLTAACLMGAVGALYVGRWPLSPSRTRLLIPSGLALFGLFTAISALLPAHCAVPGLLRCSLDQGRGFGLDAITSSVAAFGLFLSLAGVLLDHRRNVLASVLRLRFVQLTLAAWLASAISFSALALSSENAHGAQDALMILSGLAVIAVGFGLGSSVNSD